MDAQQIKEYGLSIGYNRVGICPADSLADYADVLAERGSEFDILNYTTTNPVKGCVPTDFMPEAKSVIVLVWDYFSLDYPEELTRYIGKAYLSRSYGPIEGSVAHARCQLMIKFLEKGGCKVDPKIGIPARWAGAKAGVTTYGRNNFAYDEDAGSYVIITTLVVDKEFDYDEPTMECPCPPGCRRCMDACPTGAIYEPFKLDPRKCISFNNWMTQRGREGIPEKVPVELREAIGTRLHGCDTCQDVCPRNQRKLRTQKPKDPFVFAIAPDITLRNIMHIDDDFYQRRIHPIMYNYIKDKDYFVRNAAIIAGNLEDEQYIPDLEELLDHELECVRDAAQWAIDKIRAAAR